MIRAALAITLLVSVVTVDAASREAHLVFSRAEVTYTRDIAPIVAARCAGCHRPDGDAPFSLTTFDEVRQRATQIAEVTHRRLMPPWPPEPGFGDFAGQRRLTDEQVALIGRWVALGAPRGESTAAPPEFSPNVGWALGEPDLVLPLPPYELHADGPDVFRNFVVPVPGQHARYVRALHLRPGSRAVHHANIRVDRTPASRALDDADPAPGYEGLILHSAQYPDGHFLGWTPGQRPAEGDAPHLAWTLDPAADLVLQLHLRPTGRVETLRPLIGLYFTQNPPSSTPTILRLGRQDIDIQPGAADYRVADSFTLPTDLQVHAIQPHAHYRAVNLVASAQLPDGTSRPLLKIERWDFHWQDQYRYAAPFWLPAGTRIDVEWTFDNSSTNIRNPDRPPVRVSWGWRTVDEMADVWIQGTTRSAADRARLGQQVRAKMLAEDAIGCETVLARQPGHLALRNDAALIYLELGDPARALTHFSAVRRLEPASATAWYNQGRALEALGDRMAAAASYREAVRLRPEYSAAHNNLGNLLLAEGKVVEARLAYAAAVDADATNVGARANLAHAWLGLGEPDLALETFRAALALRPDGLPTLPFAWVLATHPDPAARRPRQARELAEGAVSASGRRDARALDVLAAAYAASGWFSQAVSTATEARAAATDQDLARAIEERLELYRTGKPFTLSPVPPRR